MKSSVPFGLLAVLACAIVTASFSGNAIPSAALHASGAAVIAAAAVLGLVNLGRWLREMIDIEASAES